MAEVFCSVRMGVGGGGVGHRRECCKWWMLVWLMVKEMLVWLMVELIGEELGGGIVASSPKGFSESYGKTPHIVSHSRSISLISFCKLACK